MKLWSSPRKIPTKMFIFKSNPQFPGDSFQKDSNNFYPVPFSGCLESFFNYSLLYNIKVFLLFDVQYRINTIRKPQQGFQNSDRINRRKSFFLTGIAFQSIWNGFNHDIQ